MSLSVAESEAAILLQSLKAILKERKIGYQAISDSMDLSLPTVKRMLNKPNLPLDRLLAMCHFAGIDPSDVLAHAKRNRPKHYIFTREQDALFFKKPVTLELFMSLLGGGAAPVMTAMEKVRALAQLEKVGLLERGVRDKVTLKVSLPVGFGPESLVLRAQHTEFLQKVVAQVMSSDRKDVFAILKPLNLRREVLGEMVEELKAIVDKYAYISESRESAGALPWNLAIATGKRQ